MAWLGYIVEQEWPPFTFWDILYVNAGTELNRLEENDC